MDLIQTAAGPRWHLRHHVGIRRTDVELVAGYRIPPTHRLLHQIRDHSSFSSLAGRPIDLQGTAHQQRSNR